MEEYGAGKVTADRLRRNAYLYVRQSTLYQVAHNTESTAQQYDLRGRAVALVFTAGPSHMINKLDGHPSPKAASSS